MRETKSNITIDSLEKKLGIPRGSIRNPETGRKISGNTTLRQLREKNQKRKNKNIKEDSK